MKQEDTKNSSFIKVREELKQKGVTNNDFFLELNDESLMDVDPLVDARLDAKTKRKIIEECKINPWYFIRECVRIPSPNGQVRFDLTLGNLAMLWAAINNISFFSIFPRHCYKSCTVATYIAWKKLFFNKSVMTVITSALNDGKNIDAKIIDTIIDTLPPYLNKPSATRSFPEGIRWLDDFPFMHADAAKPCIDYIMKSMSLLNKLASCDKIIMTGIASNLSTTVGNWTYYYLKNYCIKFTEDMYDLGSYAVTNMLEDSVFMRKFLKIEYGYKDLGKDNAWFNEMCTLLNNDKDTIDRELLNIWK